MASWFGHDQGVEGRGSFAIMKIASTASLWLVVSCGAGSVPQGADQGALWPVNASDREVAHFVAAEFETCSVDAAGCRLLISTSFSVYGDWNEFSAEAWGHDDDWQFICTTETVKRENLQLIYRDALIPGHGNELLVMVFSGERADRRCPRVVVAVEDSPDAVFDFGRLGAYVGLMVD